jgi:hypothetical protein
MEGGEAVRGPRGAAGSGRGCQGATLCGFAQQEAAGKCRDRNMREESTGSAMGLPTIDSFQSVRWPVNQVKFRECLMACESGKVSIVLR